MALLLLIAEKEKIQAFNTFKEIKLSRFNDIKLAMQHITQSTPIPWHCHERTKTAPDDAVGPSQWRLLERSCVLVKE